jgi:predicted amidohydrolase YtcJ
MSRSVVLAALACLAGSTACTRSPLPPADTVLFNGAVYTMNTAQPRATAVAISDGAIVYVGDDDGAQRYIGSATYSEDLQGRMLLPGFHDTHAHVLAGGGSLEGCNLEDVRDGQRVLEMIEACMEEYDYPEDGWVIGSRWALAAFPDGNPRKEWLNEIFGSRPAFFVDTFSHSAWVSSRALEIAGITRDTPDPPQGLIERDPQTGEPTGTLRDSAMELVSARIPEASDEELEAGILRGLQEAAAFGITAYIEPGLNARQAAVYAAMDRRGEITARVLGSLSPLAWHAGRMNEAELDTLLADRAKWRGPMFRADSVKVYIDGVIETKTSYMLEPYLDGSNFPPFFAAADLNALYERLHKAGLQIHTHAIGDGAIRLALDAYEHASNRVGPLQNRHHIVHLQIIDEADIPRFGKLGVAAGFQGVWAYPDEYIEVAEALVGKERVDRFYPVASVERAGGLLVGGSDWDVSSLNPLDAIETLVRRQNAYEQRGPVLGTNENIGLDSALRAYTINAAYLMGLENVSGSIEVGKRADLIVFDHDFVAGPATDINSAEVVLTLVDGKDVFRADRY